MFSNSFYDALEGFHIDNVVHFRNERGEDVPLSVRRPGKLFPADASTGRYPSRTETGSVANSTRICLNAEVSACGGSRINEPSDRSLSVAPARVPPDVDPVFPVSMTYLEHERSSCLGLPGTIHLRLAEGPEHPLSKRGHPRLHFARFSPRSLRARSHGCGLDRPAISTQCGFASVMVGNEIDEEGQWRKLELVARVADRRWGSG